MPFASNGTLQSIMPGGDEVPRHQQRSRSKRKSLRRSPSRDIGRLREKYDSIRSNTSSSSSDCRRVCRIAVGRAAAIHGVIFELDDGTRLGKFVDDNGVNMDLYHDKALRKTAWTCIEEGESIQEVEFVATKKKQFLAHSIVFRTELRDLRFHALRPVWATKIFGSHKPKNGRPIVEVSFSEGEIHSFLTDRAYHPEICTSSSSFPKALPQVLDEKRKALFILTEKKIKDVSPPLAFQPPLAPAHRTRSRSPNASKNSSANSIVAPRSLAANESTDAHLRRLCIQDLIVSLKNVGTTIDDLNKAVEHQQNNGYHEALIALFYHKQQVKESKTITWGEPQRKNIPLGVAQEEDVTGSKGNVQAPSEGSSVCSREPAPQPAVKLAFIERHCKAAQEEVPFNAFARTRRFLEQETLRAGIAKPTCYDYIYDGNFYCSNEVEFGWFYKRDRDTPVFEFKKVGLAGICFLELGLIRNERKRFIGQLRVNDEWHTICFKDLQMFCEHIIELKVYRDSVIEIEGCLLKHLSYMHVWPKKSPGSDQIAKQLSKQKAMLDPDCIETTAGATDVTGYADSQRPDIADDLENMKQRAEDAEARLVACEKKKQRAEDAETLLVACEKKMRQRAEDAETRLLACEKKVESLEAASSWEAFEQHQAELETWKQHSSQKDMLLLAKLSLIPRMQDTLQLFVHDSGDCVKGKGLVVSSVEEIVNVRLWKQYCHHRDLVKDKLHKRSTCRWATREAPPTEQWCNAFPWMTFENCANEVLLLHGTTNEVAEKITKQGFDDRLSSRGLYGRGVYLTTDFCKALQYCDNSGTKCIMVARVILGDFFIAEGPMKTCERPPDVEGCGESHDSTMVKPGTPKGKGKGKGKRTQVHWEFVVSRGDLQIYPEFLVRIEG